MTVVMPWMQKIIACMQATRTIGTYYRVLRVKEGMFSTPKIAWRKSRIHHIHSSWNQHLPQSKQARQKSLS